VGEHAQLLMSDGMGYECQVWVKVIIKTVWKEGFAVVTICAESREVIAQKVAHRIARLLLDLILAQDCLRSDSMVPMHQDLSFSSLVSEIVPSSVRKSGCRTPCCRGRSMATASRAAGRIGDVAPDTSDFAFAREFEDSVTPELPVSETRGSEMSEDDDIHTLEIEIVRNAPFAAVLFRINNLTLPQEIVDGSLEAVVSDVCQRVSPNLMIQCTGQQAGTIFRLALHGQINDVECAVLLLRLHGQKIKELQEKFAMMTTGSNYR
jgi:hypothetical protein